MFFGHKTIGGSQLDVMHSLHEKSDNNYLLNGYSDSNFLGDKDEVYRGLEHYWIVEISSTVGLIESKINPISI